MKPINKDNAKEFATSMEKFVAWLTLWFKSYPGYCISSPTYKALVQTCTATIDLCYYLLEKDNDISYILLGFLQQDWLEGRFGWYRQLSGGNYYASILQFLQSEKSIRLRNLVNSGYNMAEIADIFAEVQVIRSNKMKQESKNFVQLLSEFRFSSHHNDVGITYYVAGYVSRGLLKRSKCIHCRPLLSDGGQPLTVNLDDSCATDAEIEAGQAFLAVINRGGLVKPSDIMYIACLHAAELYRFIKEDESLRRLLISATNSRCLFTDVFISKLEEDDYTKKILSAECESKHPFKSHVLRIAPVMFNLFATNYATEKNNEIHNARKREANDNKRDATNMKAKKLKSNC